MSAEALAERWVRPEIQALTAYQVPDASGLVKLDAMENPYPWPEELRREWTALLAGTDVNRYPEPRAPALAEALRAAMGVPEGMELLLGNGSDEIIQIICLALAGPGRAVLSVEPSFVMYWMVAGLCGMRYLGVPLRAADFSLDAPALLQAMEEHNPAVVFLAYPNNPSGNLFDEAELLEIIGMAPGLVVIDEAYAPFTDASFIPRLGRFDNLVVMRTLSKMGLAGLRLGLLAGPAAWLGQFDKVRLPYNINRLTQISAAFALRHAEVFDQQTRRIRVDRQRLFDDLTALPGVTPYPSQANFILARMPPGRAGAAFEGMKRRGVLVKRLDGAHPLLADCLRLTIGTPEENRACLEALAASLADP